MLFLDGGMERMHSEPNEQQNDKSDQNLQKVIFLKPFGGQKTDIFDLNCSKSFCKNVRPTGGRRPLLTKCDAKRKSEHKNYERGITKGKDLTTV